MSQQAPHVNGPNLQNGARYGACNRTDVGVRRRLSKLFNTISRATFLLKPFVFRSVRLHILSTSVTMPLEPVKVSRSSSNTTLMQGFQAQPSQRYGQARLNFRVKHSALPSAAGQSQPADR